MRAQNKFNNEKPIESDFKQILSLVRKMIKT